MAIQRKLKDKICRECGREYTPRTSGQKACTLPCAISYSRRHSAERAAKEQKRKDKATKERLKTKSEWKKEAQKAFNRYIRARDRGKPCISCGNLPALKFGGTIDAGHYRSTGAADHLRFHPVNCWAQCVECNRNRSGHHVEYRKALVVKLGEDRVKALEYDNTVVSYTIPQLERIKSLFNRRAARLEKRRDKLQ